METTGKKRGTKFGRQPFMDVLKERRLTMRQVAEDVGVPWLHLRHSGYGYVTPKYELRDGLADHLDLPLEELFTEASLAAKPSYGRKGRAQMNKARRP